jgi:hypothetical protein
VAGTWSRGEIELPQDESEHQLHLQAVKSFDTCEAECLANDGCNSISYSASWNVCVQCSVCHLSTLSHGKNYDSHELSYEEVEVDEPEAPSTAFTLGGSWDTAYPGYGCLSGVNDAKPSDHTLAQCGAACVARSTCKSNCRPVWLRLG